MMTSTKRILLQEQLRAIYPEIYLDLILNDRNILETTLKKLNIRYGSNIDNLLNIYELINNNIELYKKNSDFIILDIERFMFNLIKKIKEDNNKIIIDCNSLNTLNFIKDKIKEINDYDCKKIDLDYILDDIKDGKIFLILNEVNKFLFNKKDANVLIIKAFENIIIVNEKPLTLEEELILTRGNN